MKNFFAKIRAWLERHRRVVIHRNLPSVHDIKDIKGKRVLVRVDFNVPLGDDNNVDVAEAWRIDSALPTISYLQQHGARIILLSHIGRDAETSLRPVVEYLNTVQETSVGFVPAVTGPLVKESVRDMGEGKIVLLENVRSDEREKQNDYNFARDLSEIADFYVNDAFSASHREHASIVGLPKFLPSYFGFQFIDEVEHLSSILEPEHPLLFIIGGAKFETKLPLIRKMIDIADTMFVGGALTHTILKYQGYEIGTSLFEEFHEVKDLMPHNSLMTPVDVLVEQSNGSSVVRTLDEIQKDDRIVDVGPATIKQIAEKVHYAKTIVWNGPLGWYEGGYDEGTKKLLDIVAKSHAESIIGGGDTVFVIRQHEMEKKFSFVSTAGGAMLDFLSQGTLPGIEAIS